MPTTTIPQAAAAPTLDGAEGAGEYTGPALDISRNWQGGATATRWASTAAPREPSAARRRATPRSRGATTTSTSSSTSATSSRATRSRRRSASAHWLADSVEILIDPRGNSSETLMDTGTTFKLGIFPFTNDPANSTATASTGRAGRATPTTTRASRPGRWRRPSRIAPNAPGVQVVSTRDVGRDERDDDRPRVRAAAATGSRSRSRWRCCRRRSTRADACGLNITPYDNDNTAAAGTTTLRHIDIEHAARVVGVRQRAVGPVPLGPRDAAGLHAAGGAPDDAAHAERSSRR